MVKIESFELDHRKVKAPYVRKCGTQKGRLGDIISKFDLRFVQPNKGAMEISGVHTLEHLLAGFMREKLEDIIDISPMGCRTGFYMTVWEDVEAEKVIEALNYALKKILEVEEIPAANEIQCGNYKDHSLKLAKEYAAKGLEEGFSSEVFR